jgi:hypothetical protein
VVECAEDGRAVGGQLPVVDKYRCGGFAEEALAFSKNFIRLSSFTSLFFYFFQGQIDNGTSSHTAK